MNAPRYLSTTRRFRRIPEESGIEPARHTPVHRCLRARAFSRAACFAVKTTMMMLASQDGKQVGVSRPRLFDQRDRLIVGV